MKKIPELTKDEFDSVEEFLADCRVAAARRLSELGINEAYYIANRGLDEMSEKLAKRYKDDIDYYYLDKDEDDNN